MVLNPIPQSLPVHFFGSRPQPPTSRWIDMYATFAYRYGTFSCRRCDVLLAGTQCGSILRCQAAHSVWVSHIVTAATWGRGMLEDRWVCDVYMTSVSWAICVSHVSTLPTTCHLARICDFVTSVRERDNCCDRDVEWLRLVGSLKLQVSFAENRLFYRALLQKRPIILRSLLIEATPYVHDMCASATNQQSSCTKAWLCLVSSWER